MKNKDKLLINLEEMRNNKSEGSLYHAWQCNIAMAFKDEYSRAGGDMDRRVLDIHHIANEAAKNFLDLLIK